MSGSLCGPSQFKELKKPADHNVWLGGEEVDVHVDSKYEYKMCLTSAEYHAKCSF